MEKKLTNDSETTRYFSRTKANFDSYTISYTKVRIRWIKEHLERFQETSGTYLHDVETGKVVDKGQKEVTKVVRY